MAYPGGKSVISVCKRTLKRANTLLSHWAVKRPRNLAGIYSDQEPVVIHSSDGAFKGVKRDKVFFLGI